MSPAGRIMTFTARERLAGANGRERHIRLNVLDQPLPRIMVLVLRTRRAVRMGGASPRRGRYHPVGAPCGFLPG